METFLKLTELFFGKIAPIPMLVLAIASGILFFGSEHFVGDFLHLGQFRTDNIQSISLSFIISSLYVLITGIAWSALFLKKATVSCLSRRKARQRTVTARENFERRMRNLTGPEIQIIRCFLSNQTRVFEFRSDDPAMLGLYNAGILYRPQQFIMSEMDWQTRRMYFPTKMCIRDEAWDFYCKHPEIIMNDQELQRYPSTESNE